MQRKTGDRSCPLLVHRVKHISRTMMARADCINLGSDEDRDRESVQIMTTLGPGSNTDSGRDTVFIEQAEDGKSPLI